MKLQRPSSRLKFHEQSTLLGSTVFFFSNVVVCSNFTDSVQNYFYSFDNVWNENYFHNCFRLSTKKKKSSDCWDRVSRNRRNFLSIWKFNENWNSSKWLQNVNFATIFFLQIIFWRDFIFSSHFFWNKVSIFVSTSSCITFVVWRKFIDTGGFLKRRLDTFTSDSVWVASFMNVRWKTVTVSLIKYSSTVGGGTLIEFNQKILKGRRNNT